MPQQMLADLLCECHFRCDLGWLKRKQKTLQSVNNPAAHDAAPAIGQIIWCLADWGQPPRELMTLLMLEGGLAWKCVFLAPCGVLQENTPHLWSFALAYTRSMSNQLLFPLSEVYLRAFLSSGFKPLSCWPEQTDVCPLGFLVGSCKPPVCSSLYSYGGLTVIVVQVPYTCKCRQEDTL